jgi:cytochrome b561
MRVESRPIQEFNKSLPVRFGHWFDRWPFAGFYAAQQRRKFPDVNGCVANSGRWQWSDHGTIEGGSVKYAWPIKLLHGLFALGITLQLLLSTVMRQPRPGRARDAFETLTFAVHEYLGLAVLAILLLHWLLVAFGSAYKGLAHFFPWFSRERMTRLLAEANDLARLRISEPEKQDTVAGAFQGVGLVIASLLALSGGMIFIGMADDGTMSATIRSVRKVHTTLAPVMWGYLGIHVAATLAHLVVGHRSVLAIFRPRDRSLTTG